MSSRVDTHFSLSVGAGIVAAVLIIVIMSAVKAAVKGPAAPMDDESIAARIAPVGMMNTGPAIAPAAPPVTTASATPAAARSGEEVYKGACFACHDTGAAGAPKLGDKEAWGPRVATGVDALLNSAINGKNAMPPRGTCSNCSDGELKAAIEYIIAAVQ